MRRGARTAVPLETKRAGTTNREHTAFFVNELKATNDNAGTFEGYVAVFNNLDGNGDVIERGAFKRTLGMLRETKQRNGSQYLVPLLWQHDESEPIGGITDAYEDDHGLHISGEYDLGVPRGAQAYSGAKKGYLRGLSIGYRTVKSMTAQDRSRHLLEIQWFEGSPVTFPANEDAQLLSVKADGGGGKVTGSTDWPLSDRDTSWDSGAAHGRLLDWAGGKDNLDVSKFQSVHFWSPTGDAAKNVSDYKFPFCDVIGGSVKAVWGAITAATGSHGIQSAKGVDTDGIKSKISTYYNKAKKQYDDDTIEVPWAGKMSQTVHELKQLTGLAALTACAQAADNSADSAYGIVELLCNACGMGMDDGESTPGKPQSAVAALLAGVDGLEDAVKAVLTSYLEWSQQTDALLSVLGLPDNDSPYNETYVPGYGYMSLIREALEGKAGRQLSMSNRKRLQAHADALSAQVDEVKSILKDNDNPLSDEMNNADDYGDYVASGQHNNPPTSGGKGKALNRDSGHNGTTPASRTGDSEADLLTTLQSMGDDVEGLRLAQLAQMSL